MRPAFAAYNLGYVAYMYYYKTFHRAGHKLKTACLEWVERRKLNSMARDFLNRTYHRLSVKKVQEGMKTTTGFIRTGLQY